MMMSEITRRYCEEEMEKVKRNCTIEILNNAISQGYTVEQIANYCGYTLGYIMQVIDSM